jgi:hypothetical protein
VTAISNHVNKVTSNCPSRCRANRPACAPFAEGVSPLVRLGAKCAFGQCGANAAGCFPPPEEMKICYPVLAANDAALPAASLPYGYSVGRCGGDLRGNGRLGHTPQTPPRLTGPYATERTWQISSHSSPN